MSGTIGNARSVSTDVKAAFICGLFNGYRISTDDQIKSFVKELEPHARTAAQIAFGNGAFSPLAVYEMEAFYDKVVDNCERQASILDTPTTLH